MVKYENPVMLCDKNERGKTADPYVLRYNNKYYHCYMKSDGVYITESDELWNIGKGTEVRAFEDMESAYEWYAPELHRIDNSWYIYGAPRINSEEVHSMCILELKGESPLGEYEYKGMVKGLENQWSIDGTILEHEDKMWFIWTDCGKIYMSEMDSPYSLKGERIVLAKSYELEFEKRKGKIIEAPAVLKRGNKIHIVYSTNDSKSDEYCLGLLTYSGGDICDSSNWKKCENAVFEKTEEIFGPGHCSFTTVNEDGIENDYIVYHANLESGSGWYGRCVWVQKFEWSDDNIPVFGKPSRFPV